MSHASQAVHYDVKLSYLSLSKIEQVKARAFFAAAIKFITQNFKEATVHLSVVNPCVALLVEHEGRKCFLDFDGRAWFGLGLCGVSSGTVEEADKATEFLGKCVRSAPVVAAMPSIEFRNFRPAPL